MLKNKTKKKLQPYLFLAPAIIFIFVFMLGPIANVFYSATQNYVLTQPNKRGFVGLQNFVAVFNDPIFYKTLYNSLIWVVVSVVLQTVLGLWLALLLNRKFKGRGFVRALSLAPWAVAGIMTAIIWSLIFGETYGVLNDMLMKLGLISQPISWFSTSVMARAATIIANVWRGIPFFTINYLSALQTIPEEVYEACEVDGANWFTRLFRITLPMIKETIVLTTLLRSIWTLNLVDLIYGLTGGGPNYTTATLPLYVMTVFKDSFNIGYASALATITTVFMMLASLLYMRLGRLGKEEMY